MIHRVLVLMSLALCALVAISFLLFARDQVAAGSRHQANQLATTAPPAPAPTPHHPRAQPRRFIDQAASTLISPFRDIVPSDSNWVRHGIPTLIALLVYGFGLGYLARYSRGLG